MDNLLCVYIGGFVDSSCGFVLYMSDYVQDFSIVSDENGIVLMVIFEIVKEIVCGCGFCNLVFVLGYFGWGLGQLELEIKENGWFYCDVDEELIFV